MENKDYYSSIKDHLIRNEINHCIKDYSKNKGDLETYYNVGKLLVIAQGGEKRAKYGDGLIKEYSRKLTNELGKGYTIASLKRMRKFYLIIEKGAPVAHQLTWSHYQELLSLKNNEEIKYYIDISINLSLSKRQLRERIKNKEYERLPEQVKNGISNKNELTLVETVKDPIIIPNPDNIEVYKEEILEKLIIENYQDFLKELGEGYSLIGNEYSIRIGNTYHRIDILLFNYIYNCFVVVELKIGNLKDKYISQVLKYINYVDNNIKKNNHNNTIEIILCHKDNKLVMEYCSNPSIIIREYVVN